MNGLRSSQESAYYGLTEFSDLSEDEFLQRALLPDLSLRSKSIISPPDLQILIYVLNYRNRIGAQLTIDNAQ